MLKITIISVGKTKEKFWQAAIQEYSKRLKPYAVLNFVEVKPESFSGHNKSQAMLKENERLLKILAKYTKEQVYLLAERGKEYDSLTLAKFLEKNSEIVLVIGGALGWAGEILAAYSQQLSLSRLTMPHEMAKVVLLEQIYRSACIIKNKEYNY